MSQQLRAGCCCGPIQPSECPDDCPECNDAYAFSINMVGTWSFAGENYRTTLSGSGIWTRGALCRYFVPADNVFTMSTIQLGGSGGLYAGTFEVSINVTPPFPAIYSCTEFASVPNTIESQLRIVTRQIEQLQIRHAIEFDARYAYSACPLPTYPPSQDVRQSEIALGFQDVPFNISTFQITTT